MLASIFSDLPGNGGRNSRTNESAAKTLSTGAQGSILGGMHKRGNRQKNTLRHRLHPPAGAAIGDQKRIATPTAALAPELTISLWDAQSPRPQWCRTIKR